MIGNARVGSSFGGLSGYLIHGRTPQRERGLQDYLLGPKEEAKDAAKETTMEAAPEPGEDRPQGRSRVAWTEVRNLPTEDPHLAAEMMRATAEQNTRVQKPVLHLSLSASPGEHLSRERWGQVVDRVLGDLDLRDHQVLVVAHNDTRHPHVHLMVNRVHPDHFKTWSDSFLYRRVETSLRHIERDLKLREVPGHHYQLPGQEPPRRAERSTAGERRERERTGEQSWAEQVRFRVYNDFKEAENWGDLERRLAGHRLRLERRGGGLVVTDGRQSVKASRIYRRGSYAWLEKRYGMSFEAWREGRRELLDAVAEYEQTERRRRDLRRIEDDAWGRFIDASDRIDQREAVRKASREVARDLNRTLGDLYRDGELPGVRRRLAAEAREVGWAEAGRRLADEPKRYGRLRRHPRDRHDRHPQGHRQHQPHQPRRGPRLRLPRLLPRGPLSARRMRQILVRRVVSTATDLAALRSARLVAGPLGYQAMSVALLARRTWQRARHRRHGLPASKTQLTEIAGRVVTLGWSAVSLAVSPRPLQVLRVALRTAQLARAMTRGRGR